MGMGGCEGQQQKSYGKQKVILCLFFFFFLARPLYTHQPEHASQFTSAEWWFPGL